VDLNVNLAVGKGTNSGAAKVDAKKLANFSAQGKIAISGKNLHARIVPLGLRYF